MATRTSILGLYFTLGEVVRKTYTNSMSEFLKCTVIFEVGLVYLHKIMNPLGGHVILCTFYEIIENGAGD